MEGGSSATILFTSLCCMLLFFLSLNTISAVDNLRSNQTITDGSTIVSTGGHFELGFISPGKSTNRYVGIWYKKISKKTIVWIANRETPLTTTSGILKLNSKGNLFILNGSDDVAWSSNSSTSVNNPVVQLLDSGNLVIRDESDSGPENYLWQSFDKPGNTLLPGSKLGWNLESGLERYLASWKSEDDPSPGEYTYHIDRNGYPQLILRKGSAVDFRPGPWNGVHFSGTPNSKPNPIYKSDFFLSNNKESYYHYEVVNGSVAMRRTLNSLGNIQTWMWNEKSELWQTYFTAQRDECDHYALCGGYGSYDINSTPASECLDGFEPKSKTEWDVANWFGGCVRKATLGCADGEGFVEHPGLILPGYSAFLVR